MAIDAQALPLYVEQNSDKLLKQAILGSESAKMFTLQTGVKTNTALNRLSTEVKFQDGSGCGWNALGASKITQRVISAPTLKVNMPFCDKELLNTALQHDVRVAAGQKTLPFEEVFVSDVIDNVSLGVERLIWQGDPASSDPNLKWTVGLLKVLKATDGISVEKQKLYHESLTLDNVKAAVDKVVLAIPTEVLKRAIVFMGYDTYRLYVMALQAANLFHNAGDGLDTGEITYQGSNIKIKAVAGLDGTSEIVAADAANFYYGTDLLGDEEKFEFWFSQDNREFRLAVEFGVGVQCAFPDEVVISSKL